MAFSDNKGALTGFATQVVRKSGISQDVFQTVSLLPKEQVFGDKSHITSPAFDRVVDPDGTVNEADLVSFQFDDAHSARAFLESLEFLGIRAGLMVHDSAKGGNIFFHHQDEALMEAIEGQTVHVVLSNNMALAKQPTGNSRFISTVEILSSPREADTFFEVIGSIKDAMPHGTGLFESRMLRSPSPFSGSRDYDSPDVPGTDFWIHMDGVTDLQLLTFQQSVAEPIQQLFARYELPHGQFIAERTQVNEKAMGKLYIPVAYLAGHFEDQDVHQSFISELQTILSQAKEAFHGLDRGEAAALGAVIALSREQDIGIEIIIKGDKALLVYYPRTPEEAQRNIFENTLIQALPEDSGAHQGIHTEFGELNTFEIPIASLEAFQAHMLTERHSDEIGHADSHTVQGGTTQTVGILLEKDWKDIPNLSEAMEWLQAQEAHR